jgi:hypothetical protein
MTFKLTSIKKDFSKVKEKIKEEAEKKDSGAKNNDWLFQPKHNPKEKETVFRIRFLPVPESTTGKPWTEVKYHMFNRPGDNKYVKCIDPRTWDPKASNPISDMVKKLYESENPLDKDQASKLRSKGRFMTIVYVKEAPEDQKHFEGKVLVYEAGFQVFQKMENAIKKFDMCFWDPMEGTDFLLTITETGKEGEKYPSYLPSDFDRRESPIGDEEVMETVEKALNTINIKELLIKKDGLKTAEELEELLKGGTENKAEKSSAPRKEVVVSVKQTEVVKKEEKKATADVDFPETQISKPQAKTEKKKEVDPGDIDINLDDLKLDL